MRRFSSLTIVVAAWAIGCSSGGGTSAGCTALTPIPGAGRYTGPKTDNAINLQLSPEGINYVNANWQQLASLFAPGGVLTIPVACTEYTAPVVGKLYIADQGNASGAGRMNQSCTGDVPANVQATITNFRLTPRQPDLIDGEITLSIDTGKIYIDSDDRSLGACAFLSGLNASVRFWSARVAPNANTVRATLKFSIDNKWDKRLAFTAQSVTGVAVCGASGAQPPPACLEPGDIDLEGENNCGDAYLTILDWNPIKSFILELMSPTLVSTVNATINKQTCQQCGTGLPACPVVDGGTSSCSAEGVCMDTAANRCVPRLLGVEGRVNLGASMANFGVPANAALDLSIHAGSSFQVDTVNSLNIGTRGGMAAVATAPCVPFAAPPPLAMLPAPNFRAEAPPVSMTNPAYHMALGVSSPFLNLAFHQAHQGGVLCLQLSSATVGLINTGLFKTFLPSLGKLATRDGKDAPMMVVLRPAKPPDVKIGAGGMKPLITVALTDLTIDFYASIDDRFARLFSLTADITLPLSLTFSGCTSVTPAIGDLKMLVTNIRTANAEMLAEDPKVLADLIPAVVGLAEPALAGALKPIDLPDLGPFKLKVNAGKGVGNIAGTDNYNHLGLYATMLPATAACATVAPRVSASLARSIIPAAEQMRLKGEKLQWPVAVLNVRAEGVAGSPEFSTRIDDGLWSEFHPANANGELEVSHPVFLIQGLHQIEVRGRVAEDAHGISEGLSVPFMVDWDAPELKFTLDREHDRLLLEAHDVISPAERLQFSYRVGEGAWSAYGPAREIIFSAIEQQGGVTARVRDEVGNVGEVAWRVPTLAARPEVPEAVDGQAAPPQGCSAVGGAPLVLALVVVLRRRRRDC